MNEIWNAERNLSPDRTGYGDVGQLRECREHDRLCPLTI